MKILVTGVAGALGSHVAEALVRAGHQVRGLDSFTPYYARALKELNRADVTKAGVEFVEADLARDDLHPLVADVDVIYHFAAQPGIAAHVPFSDYVDNNLYATHRLLETAKQYAQLQLFIHASTSSVYGAFAFGDETTEPKPTSAYGVTKLAAEQLALSYHREQGVPVTVLRIFSAYGERERPEKLYHKYMRAALSGQPFPLFEGSEHHVRSYSYVGDIVSGCLLTLAHREKAVGEIFNLGSDKTITTGEGLSIVDEILGTKPEIVRMPKRAGDQKETAAHIEKARRVLGYNPLFTAEEGLRRQARWYRDKVHGKL